MKDRLGFNQVVTRGGDWGFTSTFSNDRIKKDNIIFRAIGDLDELNSHIGLIRTHFNYERNDFLRLIQVMLMRIMALAATMRYDEKYNSLEKIEAEDIENIEYNIEFILKSTNIPQKFILPGDHNNKNIPIIDIARTVCRRAERSLISLIGENIRVDLYNSQKYLNRLSDFLFVFARYKEQN